MGELPLPAVIGWLVHERFGGYDAETKVHGHMQHIPPDQAAEAETYRSLLKLRPEEQVRQMFQDRLRELGPEATAAIEDRESVLFFNRPAAIAKYGYWAKAQIWSVEEAVALKFGRDPDVVNWAEFERETATATPFAASYRQVAELIYRSIQAGKLSDPIEPKLFLEWCRKILLPVPEALVSAVEAMRGRLVEWQPAFLRLSEMYREAQSDLQAWSEAYAGEVADHAAAREQLLALSDFASRTLEELYAERAEHAEQLEALRRECAANVPKELKTRERESVLKLLIATVMDYQGYDPLAARSPIPGQLVAATERFGVPLSDETVRKFLKMAAELLPPEAKITAA